MKYQVLCICSLAFTFCLQANAYTQENKRVTFEKHIRPVLKAHCFECHGDAKRLRGKLDLRLRHFIVKGGRHGKALIPNEPKKSLLLKKIANKEMPPGKVKLSGEDIALIGKWIEQGAPTAGPEPKTLPLGFVITDAERNFWSFQPIERPAPLKTRSPEKIRNPIDAFILAKLENNDLTFSPEADKRTLIRRLSFDLLGLPPTPEEVAKFLADDAPGAYERLVDRMLASPHYGERWGRHWLDVAGYADSEGYTNEDQVRPYAWKYRDYVIRAFNSDMPWDRFIREQLAGDEMVEQPYRNLSKAEQDKLIATGFLRMAPDGTGSKGVDQKIARNQVVADTLQIVSSSLLGLTVHCAQCHNHRYDPIPQSDYYQLRAVFEPALDWKNWVAPAARRVTLYSDADRKKSAEIEKNAAKIDQLRSKKQSEFIENVFQRELAKLPEKIRDTVRNARNTPVKKRSAEQKKLLQKYPSVNVTAGSLYLFDRKAADELKQLASQAAKIRASKPRPDYIRALTETPGKVPTTYLFHRGDFEQPENPVQPNGLTVLTSLTSPNIPANDDSRPTTGRRLAFAKHLTSGKHPLVARVLVNRVWLHHFGRGIVETPSDFGLLGDRPTHPKLLDWLADEFMRGGWKLKRIHKLIVTSAAYRQTSSPNPQGAKIDGDNRLYWRMPIQRLEAEAIRDAILHLNGNIRTKMHGKPVPVTPDKNGLVVIGVDTRDGAGRFTGKKVSLNGEEFRRSVYIQARRSLPLGALKGFDSPDMQPNCEVRASSTVATQALYLMNNEFVISQSKLFADRVRREAGANLRDQITHAWRIAFAAEPSNDEIAFATRFIQKQTQNFGKQTKKTADAQQLALASFCQALISSNQFLYVE